MKLKASSLLFALCIPFTLLVNGCGGGSSSSSNMDTGSSDSGSQTVTEITRMNGVYQDSENVSLFVNNQEPEVYVYQPPMQHADGSVFVGSNRSLIFANTLDAKGNLKATTFQMTDFSNFEDIMNSTANLSISADSAKVLIQELSSSGNPSTLVNSTLNKLPDQSLDLMFQSYTDWDNETVQFTSNNKMTARMSSCTINADVQKMSNYYRLSNGLVVCTDPAYSVYHDKDMKGVIYQTGNNAVLILQGTAWTFRTTFALN